MVELKRQKVRFRRKKANVNRKPSYSFKGITKFLISVTLLGAIGMGLVKFKSMFLDADYFLVKTVDVKLYDEGGTLRTFFLSEIENEEIKGRNIFFIDLNEFKQKIEISHPEFKDIVIRRLLPDKLILQAKLRKSVAQIRSDRYYLVDKEGVLLPDVKNFPVSNLPIIAGIGSNLAKIQSSKFSDFEKDKLDKVLGFIHEIGLIEGLSGYRLKILDITDPGNLSFYFEDMNVEIKIGNTDFHNRLELLTTLLNQLGSDSARFKYIDLRFEDPIVGPR